MQLGLIAELFAFRLPILILRRWCSLNIIGIHSQYPRYAGGHSMVNVNDDVMESFLFVRLRKEGLDDHLLCIILAARQESLEYYLEFARRYWGFRLEQETAQQSLQEFFDSHPTRVLQKNEWCLLERMRSAGLDDDLIRIFLIALSHDLFHWLEWVRVSGGKALPPLDWSR